jgi:hypothetical protein
VPSKGIDNTPDQAAFGQLTQLAQATLEGIRKICGGQTKHNRLVAIVANASAYRLSPSCSRQFRMSIARPDAGEVEIEV